MPPLLEAHIAQLVQAVAAIAVGHVQIQGVPTVFSSLYRLLLAGLCQALNPQGTAAP